MPDDLQIVLIGVFLVCLLLHGWTAYALAVVSNVRRAPLIERAEAGDPVARRVLRLSNQYTRFQSTLIIVQWFCRTGMVAALVLDFSTPLLEALGASNNNALTVVLFVGALFAGTLVVLWLSASVPNAIGQARADQDAPAVSLLAGPLVAVLRPLVSLTHAVSNGAARLVGAENMDKAVTEEEIIALVDSGQRGGAIESEEKEMIYSVLQFGETLVREVMIPRPDMVVVPLDSPVQAALKIFMDSGHSRAPVVQGDLDDVKGVLYAKDLLAVWHRGDAPLSIGSLLRPAYFVPETKRADVLFKELQHNKTHIAIVVDEYGGTAGLITIEDLLEEIVGDIRDEYDIHEEAEYTLVGEGEYVVDGAINLREFNSVLGVDVPDEENDSIGGHIYSLIGRVPQVGEVVEDPEHRLHMVIEAVVNRRIRKVRVTVLPPKDDEDEDDNRGRRPNAVKAANNGDQN